MALCPNIAFAAMRHRVLAPSREDVADLSQVALRDHPNLPTMDACHTGSGCGSQQRIYAPLQFANPPRCPQFSNPIPI